MKPGIYAGEVLMWTVAPGAILGGFLGWESGSFLRRYAPERAREPFWLVTWCAIIPVLLVAARRSSQETSRV